MSGRNQATPVPAVETPPPAPPADAPDVDANVADALQDVADANPTAVTPDPAEAPDPDPPVYDERGNVRPRGTPGARPMTKAERTKIAHRLAAGETIRTTAERPAKGSKA